MTTTYAIVRNSKDFVRSAKETFGVTVNTLAEHGVEQGIGLAKITYPQGANPLDLANRRGFGQGSIIAWTKSEKDARNHLRLVRHAVALNHG